MEYGSFQAEEFGDLQRLVDGLFYDRHAIDRLDLHGVGIGRHQGKTIFVEGAMPGERIKARLTDDKKQHGFAQLVSIATSAQVQ